MITPPRTPKLDEISPQLSVKMMKLVEQIARESDPLQVHVQTGIVQGHYDALLDVGMLSVYNHRALRNTAASWRDYRLAQLTSAAASGDAPSRWPPLTIELSPNARKLLMNFRMAVASAVSIGGLPVDSSSTRASMQDLAVDLAFEIELAAIPAEQNEPVKSA